MRQTEANGGIERILGLAILSLSLGMVVTTGTARAQDSDGRTFSEKISDGFYSVIRGKNMDNHGIDYRERSPLVVPPTLDLPPPTSVVQEGTVANWPKNPDERARKAVIAAKKKEAPPPARVRVIASGDPQQQAQPINIAPPVQEAQDPGTIRPAYASDRNGTALTDPVYDKPGDLFSGGAAALSDWSGLSNIFGGGKTAPVEPGTEPARTALTQPPAGYQTPAAGYAYSEEKKGWLDGKSNPDRNPLAQSSSASSVVH